MTETQHVRWYDEPEQIRMCLSQPVNDPRCTPLGQRMSSSSSSNDGQRFDALVPTCRPWARYLALGSRRRRSEVESR